MTPGTITRQGTCNIARDERHHIAPDKQGRMMCIWCKQYLMSGTKVETKKLDPEGKSESFEIKKMDMRDANDED